MVYDKLMNPRVLVLAPLMLLLLFALACGTTAAPEPIIVEKEVIKEIIKEVVVEKEVIKEVPVEVVVEKQVIKEVEVQIIVTPVPLAIIKGETFETPLSPPWVAKAKFNDMTLKVVTRSNPGQ